MFLKKKEGEAPEVLGTELLLFSADKKNFLKN
jgi:hypothetical protein